MNIEDDIDPHTVDLVLNLISYRRCSFCKTSYVIRNATISRNKDDYLVVIRCQSCSKINRESVRLRNPVKSY